MWAARSRPWALLETVPGIGPYRALLIATETLPITRFRTPGHLVSYAGLAPRSSQSGLRPIRHGSIPAGANRGAGSVRWQREGSDSHGALREESPIMRAG